eukprot:gnl/Hemi2/1525_TR543_c0_g1_i1.p1 gnl/Hemi2/1525_TR543_c0_g1~~gnl/Hemi2/1525_TR543_c0_g1_i1.p1  ORF type:complete len:238 (+),score=32.81 gnl/Hemi2/1525_TR543_c0_g1_i1:119-832(+)
MAEVALVGTAEGILPPESPADKLFRLRMKMNQGRKANHQEVVDENKRKKETPSMLHKRKHDEAESRAEAWKEELQKQGEDPVRYAQLHITADRAQDLAAKAEKKSKPAAHGWDIFNSDSHYKSYKKRLTGMETETMTGQLSQYETNKERQVDFFRENDIMQHGSEEYPSQENIDRMKNELQKTANKRAKFSRRRQFNHNADIDYISERNRVFNKKAERAFGAYTAEIKANLERGTAL